MTAAGAGLYLSMATGRVALDLGAGRRHQPLGPLSVDIDASQAIVFDVIAAPYLGKTPRAMSDKVRVLERGTDMVLAEHFTPMGEGFWRRFSTTTVETVRFVQPTRVDFRLVRGPVASVTETFELHDLDGRTRLDYTGELGTDGWGVGRAWGQVVASRWVATVAESFQSITAEAERRARST